MIARILAIVLFISAAASLHAQYNDTLAARRLSSFEGYHFFVAYMQNDNIIQPAGLRLRLMMCTAYPATISVRFNKDSSVIVKLAANSATTLVVPSRMEVRRDETVLDSVVEVGSDVPIAVYAMSSQPFSSDSYAVIPVSNWDTQYTVLSMANDGYGVGNDSNYAMPPEEIRQSEFLIVAAVDGTVAEFNPTYQTQKGLSAGQWHSVTLNKGQCYLVKAAPIKPLAGDLTGTRVRANFPIAVLSGHARSAVPQALTNVTDSKDHLAEWLIPDQALGTEIISVPFYTDAVLPVGDIIRIVATQPQTQLTVYTERQDLFYTLKNAGDIQTIRGVDSPCWIRANHPVSVAQYMLTGWAGGSVSYDPSLVIVPPATKFVSKAIFQVPNNLPEPFWATQFQQHYVNVVCDSIARYSVRLDGVNVSQNLAPELLLNKFRSSPYFWARIPVTPGKHELSCDTMGFSGTLYGMGNTDSYAHTLGFSMLPDVKDTIAPFFVVQGDCGQLSGTVNEVVNAYSTSIAFVVYEPDSTKNFGFLASPVQLNPNKVTFSAHVLDPKKDGQISILVRDIAGNGRRYRYYYHAPRYTYSASVQINALTENDSICVRVYVQSPSAQDTLRIISARLLGNNSTLKLNPPSAYPIQVLPKTGVDFQLCFRPGGQSALRLNDTIEVNLGCDVILRIPVKATTPISALFVNDVDYGDVRVGDLVCKTMLVINTGTRTAVVSSAAFDSTVVVLNTADFTKIPKTLLPGDTLKLRVCYQPTDTSSLQRRIVFKNSLGVDVSGDLSGRGVRPILEDLSFDFGPRRIGLTFDTNVVLHNRGNIAAKVVYSSQNGSAAQFLHSMASIKSFAIPAHDSATFGIRFYPKLVGSYASDLRFSVDDPLDSVMTISCRGIGTVPRDSVRDINFDTITTNATKSISRACLYSKGSEALTIDTVVLGGADMFSFGIKVAQIRSRVLKVGDSLVFDIDFHPTRAGRHDAQLVVTHDADQAFFRKQSVIHLVGWAKDSTIDTTHHESPKDTLAPRLSVQMGTLVDACDSVPVTIRLTNIDTANLSISSMRLDNSFSPEAAIVMPSNIALPARHTYVFSHVYHGPLQSGSLRVQVRCNSWRWDTTLSIKVEKRVVQIDSIRQSKQPMPGETMQLRIAGHSDGALHPQQILTMHIPMPSTLFQLKSSSATMHRSTLGGDLVCTLTQTPTEIIVLSNTSCATTSAHTWWFELPLEALVDQQQSCSGVVQTQYADCVNSGDFPILLVANTGCVPNLRPIQLKGFSVSSVYPQPAGDRITLRINALKDVENLSISLTDILGRNFVIEENLFLRKDDNSLILDLKAFPSGLYRLTLRTWDDLEQLQIMLTK